MLFCSPSARLHCITCAEERKHFVLNQSRAQYKNTTGAKANMQHFFTTSLILLHHEFRLLVVVTLHLGFFQTFYLNKWLR